MASLDVHEIIGRPSLVHLVVRNVALAQQNVFGSTESVPSVTLIVSRFHKSLRKRAIRHLYGRWSDNGAL